jgi:hypothetical protein
MLKAPERNAGIKRAVGRGRPLFHGAEGRVPLKVLLLLALGALLAGAAIAILQARKPIAVTIRVPAQAAPVEENPRGHGALELREVVGAQLYGTPLVRTSFVSALTYDQLIEFFQTEFSVLKDWQWEAGYPTDTSYGKKEWQGLYRCSRRAPWGGAPNEAIIRISVVDCFYLGRFKAPANGAAGHLPPPMPPASRESPALASTREQMRRRYGDDVLEELRTGKMLITVQGFYRGTPPVMKFQAAAPNDKRSPGRLARRSKVSAGI